VTNRTYRPGVLNASIAIYQSISKVYCGQIVWQ